MERGRRWSLAQLLEFASSGHVGKGAAVRIRELFRSVAVTELDGAVSELEVMDHCRLLLRGVRVLHERGHELARVSPGMAPSGLFWRLTIAPANSFDPGDPQGWRVRRQPAVSWTSGDSPDYAGVVMTTRTTPNEVADRVLTLLPEGSLRGEDTAYTRWYAGLLAECERLEKVPVAFSDSWEPHGWQIGWGGPDFAAPPPPDRQVTSGW